jgi:hypothetical protein
MTDDGGVLGNLPNSRPGKRSAKREAGAGRPAKTAARAAAKAERSGTPAAKAASKSRKSAKPGARAAGAASPPKAARPKRATALKERGSGVGRAPVPPPPTEDPVGAVVRTAAGMTIAGVKVAGAVGREFLRRLPRP